MSDNPVVPGNPLPYGPSITLARAQKVMAAALAESQRQDWPMVIAIVDSGGHLVMLQRMDQAHQGSVEVACAKAETAARFRRPTKVFEDGVAAGGQGLRILSMPGVIAVEGGIPLVHDNQVIGAIGVSGMRSGQDAQVAAAGAAALT
ncbi:MAG TPA: heme-binding protein [Acidiferrobacteraceae bacterium]|nr:heme-binding protein [Acidiferrobacteraceae bacterium]